MKDLMAACIELKLQKHMMAILSGYCPPVWWGWGGEESYNKRNKEPIKRLTVCAHGPKFFNYNFKFKNI